MSNIDLIARIKSANHFTKSELLTEAMAALQAHPTTVTEAELKQAHHDGALAALRQMAKIRPVRQRGHPEEETREFDNVDLRHIANQVGVNTQELWQGIP